MAGVVGGFLGLGGGIVLVPFLTLVLKTPMHQAVALSLAAIMANSLVSSTNYLKKGMIDFRAVVPMCIFSSIGAVVGSSLIHLIAGNYLEILFALALTYTAVSIVRKKEISAGEISGSPADSRFTAVAVIAFFSGIFSSLLGVGGGIIIIPAMYLILNYSIHVARGSSTFIIGITATAGSVVFLMQGVLKPDLLAEVVVGQVAGGWLGSWWGARAKSRLVRIVFAVVLLYLAVRMFLQGIK